MEDCILEMRGISIAFGGIQALDNVDFVLRRGEVHALVGANGAGKSTLMKILGGVYRKDKGTIRLAGQEVHMSRPRDALDVGVAIVHQEPKLIPSLSVAANMFLLDLGKRVIDWEALFRRSATALERVGAKIDPRVCVSSLGYAERQMVEIARAVSHAADVLVLDEPSAALSPAEVDNLFAVLSELVKQGTAVIYITHRLEELPRIAARATVLRDGKNVGTVPIPETTTDELVRLILGRPSVPPIGAVKRTDGSKVLEIRELRRHVGASPVSLCARAGEIVGVFGLVGSGRTETVKSMLGSAQRVSGEILVENKPVRISSPADALKSGIGYVPEDRRGEGLVLSMNVLENICLTSIGESTRAGVLRQSKLLSLYQKAVGLYRIKVDNPQQGVDQLSGGNQQKVVVAKWLAKRLKVLILDEPTRGIDVGAKAEIHALIRELRSQGLSILMISSEIEEVMSLSDRVVVFREGRVTGEFEGESLSAEVVMNSALREETGDASN